MTLKQAEVGRIGEAAMPKYDAHTALVILAGVHAMAESSKELINRAQFHLNVGVQESQHVNSSVRH